MINLALIGVGQWGKNYLSTVKNIPNCQIKYVCSKTGKKLKLLEGNFYKTTNYRDLFQFSDIDGVIIATAGSTHFEIASEFLKKGFNILVEKPLALNYQDALKLQTLNKKESKVLVGHVYLFDPAFKKTKDLFKNLGKIRYISYESVNRGPFRDDMSILWDMGPHPISILLDLFGQDPKELQAWGLSTLRPKSNLFDSVVIDLKFPKVDWITIKISWLAPFKRRELIIVGEKDTLVYNDLRDKRVAYYKNVVPDVKGGKIVKSDGEESFPTYIIGHPLEMEVREFIGAIKERRNVETSDLAFGVKVTKLLDFAQQSIKGHGRFIKI